MKNDRHQRRALLPNEPSLRSPTRRAVLRLAGVAGIGVIAPNLLMGCSGGASASAPTFAATIAGAREAIRAAIADPTLPAASAALVDGEHVIWAEAFGTIDKALSIAPGTDTMFAIGSMSKMFATIATMILVDRTLVDLDAPLVRYVKDFRMASPEYTQITVRMLLSHSSGFPGTEMRNSSTFVPFPGYAKQTQETLATARLKHAPGELAVYCNDGFTMIDPLVSAVTGESYTQFVQDEILTRLGMSHSRFPTTTFPAGSYAPGYIGDVKQAQEHVNTYASGGLYSTPSDMGRVAMMLMNGGELDGQRILSAAAVAEMGRDQTASLPFNPVPARRYGLGWDGVAQPGLAAVGVTAWHKYGQTAFYHNDFFVAPTERLAVIISGSSTNFATARLAEFILLRALAERRSIARVPPPLPQVPLPARAATDAELAAIAGCYGFNAGVWRIDPQADGTLTIFEDVDGTWQEGAAGLKLRDDGTFSSDTAPGVSYRALAAAGRRYLVQRTVSGWGHYTLEWPHAQHLTAQAPVSAAWQARLGRQWLAVNQHPRATTPMLNVSLHAVPELAGYIIANNGQIVDPAGSDTLARMCLKIPMENGSNLYDVVIEPRGGEEWVRMSSVLFRPQATVPVLAAGSHTVTIGNEGHGEWRKLPIAGTVTIAGAAVWALFNADLAKIASGEGAGGASLPGSGSAVFLLLYGTVGAAIDVTVA